MGEENMHHWLMKMEALMRELRKLDLEDSCNLLKQLHAIHTNDLHFFLTPLEEMLTEHIRLIDVRWPTNG